MDVKERARELVSLWENHNSQFVSLFYDGHACFNNLMAGDTAANTVLLDNMREYINDNRKVRQVATMGTVCSKFSPAEFSRFPNFPHFISSKVISDCL